MKQPSGKPRGGTNFYIRKFKERELYQFLHWHGFTNPSQQTHGFEYDVCRNSYTIGGLDSLVTSYFHNKTLTCGKIKQTKEETMMHRAYEH